MRFQGLVIARNNTHAVRKLIVNKNKYIKIFCEALSIEPKKFNEKIFNIISFVSIIIAFVCDYMDHSYIWSLY